MGFVESGSDSPSSSGKELIPNPVNEKQKNAVNAGQLYYRDEDGALYELNPIRTPDGKIPFVVAAADDKLSRHDDDSSLSSDHPSDNWVSNVQRVRQLILQLIWL